MRGLSRLGLGVLSPTSISSDQNNYAPTNHDRASVARINPTANLNLTGWVAGADGDILIVANVGTNVATFTNESTSSTAANRFSFGRDVPLPAGETLLMWYDAASQRWRLCGDNLARVPSLVAVTEGMGDPFNDVFNIYSSEGATPADRIRKISTSDFLIGQMFRKMTYVFDDFSGSGSVFFKSASNGGNEGQSNQTEQNHPGVWNFSTGTNATGAGGFLANAYGIKIGGGITRLYCVLKSPGSLSTSAQRYGIVFGLSTNFWNFAPSDTIFLRYRDDSNAGKWDLYTNNGSGTSLDTGVTFATNTWYRLFLEINAAGNSVSGSIASGGGAPTTFGPKTTNIPSTGATMSLQGAIIKAVGTTDRDFNVDFAGFVKHFSTAR